MCVEINYYYYYPPKLENRGNEVYLVFPWKNRKLALNFSLNLEFILNTSEFLMSMGLKPTENVRIIEEIIKVKKEEY